MGNHHDTDGDLVVEDRTLFRQIGWQGHGTGVVYQADAFSEAFVRDSERPAGYSPVYVQIAVDHGEGWED